MAERVQLVLGGRDAGAGAILGKTDGMIGRLSRSGASIGGTFSRGLGAMMMPLRDAGRLLGGLVTLPNLVAASIGGVLVNSVIEYADAIDDASLKTGVAREDLQALRLQATENKASFEAVTRSLAVMARNAKMATEGENEQSRAFRELGVTVTDANGKLRPMMDILEDAADGMQKLDNDTERAAIAQRVFGRGGKEIMVMLKNGAAGIDQYRKTLQELGMSMTDDQIKQLAALKDSMARLKMQGMSVMAQILGSGAGEEGMKILQEGMEKIAVLAKSGQLQEYGEKLAAGLRDSYEAAKRFGDWVQQNGGWLARLGLTAYGVRMVTQFAGSMNQMTGGMVNGAFQAKSLGGSLTGVTGQLTTIAAVAGTAFAGWQLGRVIGEASGLNKELQTLFDKLFAIDEKGKEVYGEDFDPATLESGLKEDSDKGMRDMLMKAAGLDVAKMGLNWVNGMLGGGDEPTGKQAPTQAGGKQVVVNGPVTVVADNPEEFGNGLERETAPTQE